LDQIIEFLLHFDVLNNVMNSFQNDLESLFIDPLLRPPSFGPRSRMLIGDFGIRMERNQEDGSPLDVLYELEAMLRYLYQNLPLSISQSLLKALGPRISIFLVKYWLSPALPSELTYLNDFEQLLNRVAKLCDTLKGLGWHEQGELTSWINQVARHWLTRRRIDSLDQVRKILLSSTGSTKCVERVEKELVSNQSDVLLGADQSDDWNADWEEEDYEGRKDDSSIQVVGDNLTEEGQHVSTQGLDKEYKDAVKRADDFGMSEDDEEAADAWGWGDEENDQESAEMDHKSSLTEETLTMRDGHSTSRDHGPREITLTEHYIVTDIPDSVIDLIDKQISDSESLKLPEYVALSS
jgi:protein transport protein DSL1/ZW10